MQKNLISLLENHGLSSEKSLEIWKAIEKAYSKSTAFYHNLAHIKNMVQAFEKYKSEIEKPSEVLLAIYFHDFVYDIHQTDNEEKSAEAANECLADAQNLDLTFIKNLILSTKTHQASHKDAAYLIDFDLQILGSNPEEYEAYTQKIRKEHRAIPNKIYKPARKLVLEGFLAKTQIYQTASFQDLYEANARENISRELAAE